MNGKGDESFKEIPVSILYYNTNKFLLCEYFFGLYCADYGKHPFPLLADKVCHLQQISYKGTRFKHLKDAGVMTVKDLLRLLYTDPIRLENVVSKCILYVVVVLTLKLIIMHSLVTYADS